MLQYLPCVRLMKRFFQYNFKNNTFNNIRINNKIILLEQEPRAKSVS